ncbi:hypothetical protein PhCBS80983_g01161 [Powellomyces hirtus]|uniref:Uncharacterized protein n=1 Tax=Powellomyces hirtus TaxID=109895 RepID=A0A507EBA4_9FUNG|nr:hypothetical protein PhCBS80983_g01161 [Powellomyces hirtus]
MITQVNPRESRLIVLQTGSFQTKAGYVDHLTIPFTAIPSIVGVRQQKGQSGAPIGIGISHVTAPEAEPSEINEHEDEGKAVLEESTPTTNVQLESTAAQQTQSSPGDPVSNDDRLEEAPPANDLDALERTYIAGSKLASEGISEETLICPIHNGTPADWHALAGLWQHILLRELPTPINRSRNDWSVLMTVPVSWSKVEHARATQIMFEEINMLAFTIVEQPLAALYGCNLTTGLVIDIGHETTDVTPIIDNNIIRYAHKTIPLGGRDIELYLKRLLQEDPVFMSELAGADLTDELVRHIKETACEINVSPESSRPAPVDATKRVSFSVNGKEYTIGSARYRCADVLFDPLLFYDARSDHASMGIHEACYLAVTEACEPEKRTLLWDALLLTGGCAGLKGLRHRLDKELMGLVSASETSNEFQAKELKWAGLPDYFTAYKDCPNDLTYLGASIVARIVFTSSSFAYVTKADYNEMGPAAIYLKT